MGKDKAGPAERPRKGAPSGTILAAPQVGMSAGAKTRIERLAIFGGRPAFKEPLHVGRPNIGDRWRLLQRMAEVLDNRWLTNNGPMVQEFERRLEELLGVRHCIAMCNATVALEIAVRAAGMKGEVIVPSFTFVATAHALQWQEITPVFCDIDPRTHSLDPARVESMITPRTSGILGVHVWGNPCDVESLSAVAQRHGLGLIFDAAHAFGCSYEGKMIGNFGDAEVFSFHATKFLNTFEGGAVTTNNDELAKRIRLMKNFGFAGVDSVVYIGTNGKMAEIAAAMGITGLESLTAFVAANQSNYREYLKRLDGLTGIDIYAYDESERCNYQYVVVRVDNERAGLSRDQLVEILRAENILARRYFHPGCHQMEPYKSYFPHAGLLLPETEKLTGQVMTLPTGTAIGSKEIAKICEIIATASQNATEVKAMLARRSEEKAA